MEAEKQEKTDNELIAKFMGFKKNVFEPEFYVLPSTFNNGPFCSCESLLFDTSWDWLMPVVDTIASLDFAINTYYKGNGCRVSIHEGRNINGSLSPAIIDCDYSRDKLSLIDTTYKAVVEFIKWYKSQGNASSSTSE